MLAGATKAKKGKGDDGSDGGNANEPSQLAAQLGGPSWVHQIMLYEYCAGFAFSVTLPTLTISVT
jgi:hypothetical protein